MKNKPVYTLKKTELIGMDAIQDLIELVLFALFVAGEHLVSLLLVSESENGKTELMLKYRKNRGVHALRRFTAYGILTDLKNKVMALLFEHPRILGATFNLKPQGKNRLQKPKRKKRYPPEEYYDGNGLYYCCPICNKTIRYLAHPSMGEAWSRGRVRGEHLRSHGIDQRYISPARKDDPLLIRELFQWNQKRSALKRLEEQV